MNGCKLKIPVSEKEDKTSISKAGSYIIRISLYNSYKQILHEIKSVFVFGTEEVKKYNSKFHIRIRSISEDLKLYYSVDDKLNNIDNFDINSIDFNNDSWIKLKANDTIPDNVSYIACFNEELDRLIETGFEIELRLDENRTHDIYKLFTRSIAIDTNIDFSFEYEIRRKYKWNGRVVYKMLRDEVYNGTLTQGKTRRISYKNHKCIVAKKQHWVSVGSALEKVFDDETWLAIQEKLNEASRSGSDGVKHIFCGKVYCEVCGSILHKNSSRTNSNSQRIDYLLCRDKQNKWANCDNSKSIKLNELKDYVIQSINNVLEEYYDSKILTKLHKEVVDKDLFKDKIENLNKEKMDIQALIKKKNGIFHQLYEDRAMRIIDDSDFTDLRKKYKDDVDKLNERLLSIDDELKLIEIKQNKLKNKETLLSKYQHIEELTPQMLDEFIDKIQVGKVNPVDNTRNITIVWNFQT